MIRVILDARDFVEGPEFMQEKVRKAGIWATFHRDGRITVTMPGTTRVINDFRDSLIVEYEPPYDPNVIDVEMREVRQDYRIKGGP